MEGNGTRQSVICWASRDATLSTESAFTPSLASYSVASPTFSSGYPQISPKSHQVLPVMTTCNDDSVPTTSQPLIDSWPFGRDLVKEHGAILL